MIVLADSRYGKSEIFALSEAFDNLEVICNVRKDTVLYDLPPSRTGKRGRPPRHGKRISLTDDFTLSDDKIGDYHVAYRRVITNLLKQHIMMAFVTAPKIDGSRWRFLSTIDAAKINILCAQIEKSPLNQCGRCWFDYVPLFCYAFRWNIEVS